MAQSLTKLTPVVVTGFGAITSLGITFEETWNNMLAGYSGVKKNEINNSLPCKIAANIPRIDNESTISNNDSINNNNPPNITIYDPKHHLNDDELFYTDPSIQYALTATSEAMHTSTLYSYLRENPHTIDRYRIAVSFASALGGLQSFVKDHNWLQHNTFDTISPHHNANRMMNSSALAIASRYGFHGPNLSSATACSASAHAIQNGYHLIQSGICDVAIVGGTEAAICDIFVAGLCRCKALATKYNDEPYKASRPWDKDRKGFVIGEGAACLILESEEFAQKRGITEIYGEIVGVGSTADAFHCTGLDPSGIPAKKSMEIAIEFAKKYTNDKDFMQKLEYINAHATSTDIGDKTELKAIVELLEEQKCSDIEKIKINGTKSSIGHLMGASGAMEAVLTLKALKTNIAPPTLNLDNADSFVPSNVNLVPNEPQTLSDECLYALSNSFGFGGTNASIVFKKRDFL